ncbi:MAG: hypothetical protein IPM92_05410 [Saprospiraceae bacterium]|nr:hypothetical protein [Saprospiraceae bacterium]
MSFTTLLISNTTQNPMTMNLHIGSNPAARKTNGVNKISLRQKMKCSLYYFGLILLTLVSTADQKLNAQSIKNMDAEVLEQVKGTLKENAKILRFMENKGQLDNPNVLYYLDGKQGTILIEKTDSDS